VSRHITFIGKGYDGGGLCRLSLLDVCNKVANNVDFLNELDLWHSRLCHVNAGRLNFNPEFSMVKGSKCHVCVQLK